VLRRHLSWLDFLSRAACGHRHWIPGDDVREQYRERALQHWYDKPPT